MSRQRVDDLAAASPARLLIMARPFRRQIARLPAQCWLARIELARRLRETRGERTQRELADLAGVSPGTYSRAERGESVPLALLDRIVSVLLIAPGEERKAS